MTSTKNSEGGQEMNGCIWLFRSLNSFIALLIVLIVGCIPFSAAAFSGFRYSPTGASLLYGLDPDGLTLALPVDLLNGKLRTQIEKTPIKPDQGVEVKIKNANGTGFLSPSVGADEFVLQVRVDGEAWIPGVISTDFACTANVRFAISPAPIIDAAITPLGSSVACSISNDLVRSVVQNQLHESFGKDLPQAISKELLPRDLLDNMKADPEVLRLLRAGYVAGSYCNDSQGRIALCAHFRWAKGAVHGHMDTLVASAPMPKGTAEVSGFDARRVFLRANSPRKIVPNTTYAFPAGLYGLDTGENGSWETGDMALFGGLLCLSGESEGCTLLKCSQSASGQIWRSPNRVNEPATPDHSPFSGDQFNGVVAFFLGNKDMSACPLPGSPSLTNKDRLTRYLGFVSSNKVSYTNNPQSPDFGYKSCNEVSGKETCLLQGKEWAWLNGLVDREGLSPDDLIPKDSRDFRARYGFEWDFIEWMATFSPLGKEAYQTHLVAVDLFLAQIAGINHPSIQRAAAILAARQPNNPFYLYLHLGRDQLVADALRNTCFGDPAAGDRGDWAWQRDSTEEAWKKSMGWDCVFMLNLMMGSAGPDTGLDFNAQTETEETNIGNGCAGKSNRTTPPVCVSAAPGKVLLQGTARLELIDKVGALPGPESCEMAFSDFAEALPDIRFPRTVCVTAKANSYAGFSNTCGIGVGNRGRAVCRFRASQAPIGP